MVGIVHRLVGDTAVGAGGIDAGRTMPEGRGGNIPPGHGPILQPLENLGKPLSRSGVSCGNLSHIGAPKP